MRFVLAVLCREFDRNHPSPCHDYCIASCVDSQIALSLGKSHSGWPWTETRDFGWWNVRRQCFIGLRQQGTVRNWYAKALCLVTDPHAEVLRWMELSCSRNLSVNHHGYLTATASTNILLRLLTLQVFNSGASLEDLGAVLQMPIKALQGYIIDLQLSGQIYQNREGNYVIL